MFAKTLTKAHARMITALPLFFAAACTLPANTHSIAGPAAAFTPRALSAACDGRTGWSDPAPSAKIHGSTYYVGTCGIAALLIDSGDGLILIDGATPEAGPAMLANIARLGFDAKTIRIILASHEHYDHVGGLGAVQQTSGAPLFTLPAAAAAMQSGRPDPGDPQATLLEAFLPLTVRAELVDGQPLRLGHVAITPHATPAHSIGSTSYSWQSCEGETCHTMAFADSLSTPTPDDYRFADHPEQLARVTSGLEKAAGLHCDILITPHPSASSLFERMSGERPLANPQACARYAAAARQNFKLRLAKEKE